MYFVYVLQSLKDKLFYTGFTNDLERRVNEHNEGLQISTRSRTPFELIYYEWCLNKKDAIKRENYLKSGIGKKFLKSRLRNYFEENRNLFLNKKVFK